MKKHLLTKLAAIGCLVAAIAIEVAVLYQANEQYQQSRAAATADHLKLELGLLDSAIQRGDLAAYESARQRATAQLENYRQNPIVLRAQQETITAIDGYFARLTADDAQITAQIRLRAAIQQLAADAQTDDGESLFLQNLQQDLRVIQTLSVVQPQIKSYTTELIRLLEKVAPCIDICPQETFANFQTELQDIQNRYRAIFEQINTQLVETYSPHAYILLLE